MAISTRRPTGAPAWDLTLIAAREKCGKSYAAAQASGIDYIGRTFWIPFGENEPDEYGAIPGADFEIVNLDDYGGVTYAGVMNAIRAAVAEPRVHPDKPNLIVLDSAGRVWTFLSNRADYAARKRLAKKQKLNEVPLAEDVAEDINIGHDLWNSAGDLWLDMLDLLKSHDGPVILTTLIEEGTVFENGQPTKKKDWKILGQKRFAADVGIVIEIPKLREVYVTGVRSLQFEPVKTGEHTRANRFHDFTVEKLWTSLGLGAHTAKAKHANIVTAQADDAAAQQQTVAQQIMAALNEVSKYDTPQKVLAGLDHVARHFGDEPVATVIPFRGEQVPWVQVVDTIRQRAQAAVAAAQQEVPAQSEAPAQPAQEAPVPAQPAQDQPAQESEGARAAAAQTAQDTARSDDPFMDQLLDEIRGQAGVLGVDPAVYVTNLMAFNVNAASPADLPARDRAPVGVGAAPGRGRRPGQAGTRHRGAGLRHAAAHGDRPIRQAHRRGSAGRAGARDAGRIATHGSARRRARGRTYLGRGCAHGPFTMRGVGSGEAGRQGRAGGVPRLKVLLQPPLVPFDPLVERLSGGDRVGVDREAGGEVAVDGGLEVAGGDVGAEPAHDRAVPGDDLRLGQHERLGDVLPAGAGDELEDHGPVEDGEAEDPDVAGLADPVARLGRGGDAGGEAEREVGHVAGGLHEREPRPCDVLGVSHGSPV